MKIVLNFVYYVIEIVLVRVLDVGFILGDDSVNICRKWSLIFVEKNIIRRMDEWLLIWIVK